MARLASRGVKVVGALVEKDHPWAMAYWGSVGFELEERFVLFKHGDVGSGPRTYIPAAHLTPYAGTCSGGE